jgi:integrase
MAHVAAITSDPAGQSYGLDAQTTALLEAHINKYGTGESGLVFSTPNGRAVTASNFRMRHWNPATEKVTEERVKFHSLRTTHFNRGQEAVLSERLGHSDPSGQY